MEFEPIAARVSRLGQLILPKGWLLTCAESCTGGMLASAIVSDLQTSAAFERGFVVYSLDSKCELLGLESKRVHECAGVAEDVARAMARAALERSNADLSVAITGFAGPQEGEEEVGLVHVATATRHGEHHCVLRLGDVGREEVCRAAVETALDMLIDAALRLRSAS